MSGGGEQRPPATTPAGERGFRWRGADGSRLEALGDGVFALSLTLLLLSSEVPTRSSDLWRIFQEAVPFLITFAILGMIWFGHFLFFRRYGLRDRWVTFLNFALLFLVLLYVYPLKFVFSLVARSMFGLDEIEVSLDAEFPIMEFYGVGFGLIYVVFTLMYRHAWKLREQLGLDGYERSVTRQWMWQHIAMVSVAAVSVIAAIILPSHLQPVAGFLYAAIGPVMGIMGFTWQRRRERAGLTD